MALETSSEQLHGKGLISDQHGTPLTQSTDNSNMAVAQRNYEECRVVGVNNHARQHPGNLGNYVVGIQKYTKCTVTGNGAQFNGSASGE